MTDHSNRGNSYVLCLPLRQSLQFTEECEIDPKWCKLNFNGIINHPIWLKPQQSPQCTSDEEQKYISVSEALKWQHILNVTWPSRQTWRKEPIFERHIKEKRRRMQHRTQNTQKNIYFSNNYSCALILLQIISTSKVLEGFSETINQTNGRNGVQVLMWY